MIRIRVDAVLRVLDGFTGQPLAPSALRCTVDGVPFRPIAKTDGYYVLMGLTPGEHRVVLQSPRYQEEQLLVTAGSREGHQEFLVTMKPGDGYPFGQAVTRLTLQLQQKKQALPGGRVWIATKNPLAELRVAQDVIQAGNAEGRLFFPESVKAMSMPRDFLLSDGSRSEVCRLEELEGARFAAPLRFDHKRSCCLYPAQLYTADGAGIIRAVFREPLPVEILAEGQEKPLSLTLQAGENQQVLSLDKK